MIAGSFMNSFVFNWKDGNQTIQKRRLFRVVTGVLQKPIINWSRENLELINHQVAPLASSACLCCPVDVPVLLIFINYLAFICGRQTDCSPHLSCCPFPFLCFISAHNCRLWSGSSIDFSTVNVAHVPMSFVGSIQAQWAMVAESSDEFHNFLILQVKCDVVKENLKLQVSTQEANGLSVNTVFYAKKLVLCLWQAEHLKEKNPDYTSTF